MFQRRRKPSVAHRIGNFFWPRIGLRRWLRYLGHRLARMPGTPYSIAAGFACGAAVSMTPFVGLHFILGAVIAWLIGANVVAALIGTVVGNPWTFPFIWLWTHKLGGWILGGQIPAHPPGTEHFADIFGSVLSDIVTGHLPRLFEAAWPVVLPMIVGSVPMAITAWVVFYFLLRRPLESYRRQRARRRDERRAEREREGAIIGTEAVE